MSTPLNVNGVIFPFPQQFNTNWGPTVTNWATAVTLGMMQANGSNPMTGNLTFTNNGMIILKDSEGTPKSVTLAVPSPVTTSYILTLPGTAGSNGQILSTDGSGITSWVNASGTGTINSGTTGQIGYYTGNGTTISGETISGDATIAAGGALTISALAITNAKVATAAAIALSKLASTTAYYWYAANSSGVLTPLSVTASQAVITDSNGLPAASSTTSTELGYVHGVTSAIQTQIGTLLPLSGGTMSGNLNMGSNNIVSLAQATTTGQAIAYPITLSLLPAITQVASSATGASSDLANTITTKSITTTGGTVLIFAHLEMVISSGSFPYIVSTAVTRGGTGINGCTTATTLNAGASAYLSPVVIGVDTPSAGTYTYNFTYAAGGNTGTIPSYSLVLVELKQ